MRPPPPPPHPTRLTRAGFEAADRVAVAGPAPFPAVLLVELKHVDSYHVLSDAAQRRGRRRDPAGVAAAGGRVPGGRQLDGAGGLAAAALPRRQAAAPMAQSPQQEAAGQAGGHQGDAAGRPGTEWRRLGRCLRLGLPVGPAAPGRGAAGLEREEGGWGRPTPLPAADAASVGPIPGPGGEELRPGGGGVGLWRGAGAALRSRGELAGEPATFLQRRASPPFKA